MTARARRHSPLTKGFVMRAWFFFSCASCALVVSWLSLAMADPTPQFEEEETKEMPFKAPTSTPLHESPTAAATVQPPRYFATAGEPSTCPQDTALVPRPGQSPSKDGTTTGVLGSGKVTIALPEIPTSPRLNALADKLDGLLSWLQALAAISSGGIVLPWVVRAGSGLLALFKAVSSSSTPAPPGAPPPSQAANQGERSSIEKLVSLLESRIGAESGTAGAAQSQARS